MISPAKGARRSKSGKEKKSKSEKKAASSPPRGSAEGEAAGGDAEGVAARALREERSSAVHSSQAPITIVMDD